MLKIDRQNQIEQILHEQGSVLISKLSEKLHCSEETIRRDLREMEMQNKLKRIHGGAYLPEKYDKSVPIEIRESLFNTEKERMASYVINSYIEDNDVIMLDSSTTCLKLAQSLLNSDKHITVITNSLKICNVFNNNSSSHIKLTCVGGDLCTRTSSFSGYKTTEALQSFLADKSFISCPSVDLTHGLVDNNLNDSMIRATILQQSRLHFLIVDHTKFSETANVKFAELNNIDVLVTDKKLSPEWTRKCLELNLKIDYC
ncbi:hypothetical protein Z965_07585 [Clostridium novyi A str. BKT29909]|uniref:DeoR/GlpR family DNA-binding transcription regulator n=1 Tax=Clostridium novyi TaxID=1542 RepID=UPI0004D9FA4C|nr:DeoR/GlpR family DNA-binding transcription regulator [Clostridium novyi]KEH91042.1 hypothetical protein Z965_07585 [Clostridium novyi A str. BKT29909]